MEDVSNTLRELHKMKECPVCEDLTEHCYSAGDWICMEHDSDHEMLKEQQERGYL